MRFEDFDKRILLMAQDDPIINSAVHAAIVQNLPEVDFFVMLVEILTKLKNESQDELIKIHKFGIPPIILEGHTTIKG